MTLQAKDRQILDIVVTRVFVNMVNLHSFAAFVAYAYEAERQLDPAPLFATFPLESSSASG